MPEDSLMQMRAYLPRRAVKQARRLAGKQGLSPLLVESLQRFRSAKLGCLPVSRKDWQTVMIRVPRSLHTQIAREAERIDARHWDLVSAVLIASLAER